jgi:hypothetical protein
MSFGQQGTYLADLYLHIWHSYIGKFKKTFILYQTLYAGVFMLIKQSLVKSTLCEQTFLYGAPKRRVKNDFSKLGNTTKKINNRPNVIVDENNQIEM